jgi:hypothetical protein
MLAVVSAARSGAAAGKEIYASDFNVGGPQTSFARVRGADRAVDANVVALGFASNRVGFGIEKGFGVRVVNSGSFALGAKGIQGGFDSALAGGYRIPIARTHGVMARVGAEGGIFGNKYLWDSMLEVPQLHLGYQWLVPDGSVVDVAMKGGYVLFGRHNVGDAGSQSLDGSPEVGGIGTLHLGPVDLRATYTRFFPRHGAEAVDELESVLCGRTRWLVICETVRYEVGDVRVGPRGDLRSSQVSFIGITLAVPKRKTRLD